MHELLNSCTLCPRRCRVNRTAGEIGFCGQTDKIYAARAALHYWEEPCISGKSGSGTVFFSGCTLRCVYCQNYQIANGRDGMELSTQRLSEIFLELQQQKANNINLVTPTHFAPQIIQALKIAKENGLSIPIVYNTSGYETVETLRRFEGITNIYLPDFKYFRSETAKKYSAASDYPEIAKKAIAEMLRQCPKPVFAENGILQSGVIARLLLLPGHLSEAKQIVQYLNDTYGDSLFLSLMNQYTPLPQVADFPELNRRVTAREYDALLDYAIALGVENAFIQEGETASESFIPPFNYEGLT